jgi:hypothetical protein
VLYALSISSTQTVGRDLWNMPMRWAEVSWCSTYHVS